MNKEIRIKFLDVINIASIILFLIFAIVLIVMLILTFKGSPTIDAILTVSVTGLLPLQILVLTNLIAIKTSIAEMRKDLEYLKITKADKKVVR